MGLSEVEMALTLRAAVCSGVVLHALIKLVCGEFIVFRHAVTETANIALVITLAAALTCG